MKINKISITNYRSIKDTQLIENIGNSIIFTGINNSGKSTVLNSIAVFIGDKDVNEKDFYIGTEEIKIIINFTDIEDSYLKQFCEFKKNRAQTTALKENEPFISYGNETISSKDDLDNAEQVIFLEKERMDKFKTDNDIVDGNLSVECIININDTKKRKYNKLKIEKIFPNIIFINDERNFENEEFGGTGSITKKFFEGLELKKDNDLPIEDIKEKKGDDLDISELEKLLRYKSDIISNTIGEKVSANFSDFYEDNFTIKINTNTSISHKNFSLETKLVDPILGEMSLSNVGAGLRALYLLSLLKAYNDFNKNNHTIFLIEEPELYLHPGLQKEMANILLNISKVQQVFFTTHSPILLKNFDLVSIKEVKKNNHKSEIGYADFNDIINNLGYSLFDIIRYKYLIFVEGRDDYNVLKQIINKFYSDKIDEVEIITSNGCGNLAFYASLKFLGLTNNEDLKYFILRDRDNKSDEDLKAEFIGNLTDKDLGVDFINELSDKFKILDRYSIENYFLDEGKITTYYADFNIDDFVEAFNNREGKIRKKDSLRKENEPEFVILMAALKTSFSATSKLIRGHNIFDALVYYVNGSQGQFIHNKTKREDFVKYYIDNSVIEDFSVIKDYLDELFSGV